MTVVTVVMLGLLTGSGGQFDPMEFHTDKDAGLAEHVLRIAGVGLVVRLFFSLFFWDEIVPPA